MAVRITVAGSSKEWWTEAQAQLGAGKVPAAIQPVLNGHEGEVTVDSQTWRQVWDWASALRGWTESDKLEQLGSEFDVEG